MKQASLILAIIGVMLFVFGLNVRQRRAASLKRTHQAPGQVIDKQEDQAFSGEAPQAVLLTIQYRTALGQTCDFQVRQMMDSGANVGDIVDVFYNPARPEQAAIGVPQPRSSLFAISFMLGGCAFLLLAILLYAAS